MKKLNPIEREIEKKVLSFKQLSKPKRKKIEAIIEKSNKKRTISLRVNAQDLDRLKMKAEREGIPYQTLILSVLHKFVNDQLVDQNEIVKSLQLLKFG